MGAACFAQHLALIAWRSFQACHHGKVSQLIKHVVCEAMAW